MKDTWNIVKEHFESTLPTHTFNTWIKPLALRNVEAGKLFIEVPNTFYKDRIQSTYASMILAKVRQLSEDRSLDIAFVLPESSKANPNQWLERFSRLKNDELREKKLNRAQNQLNQRYSFDSFVVGNHNQFAHAAAIAVSESPGMLYNPLLIYGGVGLGKTHLLCAIGNEILARDPSKRVIYKTSEDFVNQLIHSIRSQKMDEFRNQYRSGLDVLLIDDIQFFSGKERTQEEFFHTFNALHQSNIQIVMTSDRMPKDIADIDERLRSRFEWGLYCDVSAPDLETCMAILRKKAEQSLLSVPDDVIEYLAQTHKGNIRTLEGSLISLLAKASLQRRSIDLEFAQSVFAVAPRPTLSVDGIQHQVAQFFNLTVADLRSQSRQKIKALPRQIAMYLSRKWTSSSFPEIGTRFGGKDHTTVMHAVEKIEKLILEDVKMKNTVEALEKNIASA